MDQYKYVVKEGRKNVGDAEFTYLGFTLYTRKRVKPGIYLAVVTVLGETDIWLLENDGLAVEELRRYYLDTYGVTRKVMREHTRIFKYAETKPKDWKP